MLNKFFRQTKSASALLIVIFILGGIFLVAFGVGYMVFFTLKNGDNQANAYRAYYAAEAGQERGNYEIYKNGYNPKTACIAGAFSDTLTNLASYNINCASSSNYLITSSGVYKGINSSALTCLNPSDLILHFDKSPLIDSSLWPYTLTNSSVVATSGVTYFGTSSGYFSSSTYLEVADSASKFDFGTSDFTIDFWLKTPDVSSAYLPIVGTKNWCASLTDSDIKTINFNFGESGLQTYATTLDSNWHHIAVVGSNGLIKIYFDGLGGDPVAQTAISGEAYNLTVGACSTGDALPSTGPIFLDELRIVKGRALYYSNFTPTTTPYAK